MATIPNDPLFPNQWHLQNRTAGQLDLNVVDVWDDYTGVGVEVAVIDDGVQRTHPDLNENYSTAKDWDFILNETDPSSADGDNHGTAVAGIIGANANNGIGGVGVAYGSTLFGFRGINSRNIADAINNASGRARTGEGGRNREADVVNISLGSIFETLDRNDNLTSSDYFSRGWSQVNTAIDHAIKDGRNRFGTILVKSAGNDREGFLNADTNASSWNANPHTISVAAVNRDGFVSSYSTHGASILVSGFGSPRRGQIVTTDRRGNKGRNKTDYRSDFNGTSAAAPMVSGVVALMLEANSNLGWRDVQEILAYSAHHVGSDVGSGTSGDEEYAWSFNSANNWNGGGLHFSNDYGFGLVDAKAAVRLAETWGQTAQTSANDVSVASDFLDTEHTIRQRGTSFSRSIHRNIDIEHVEVNIQFTRWDDLGDLEVRLISPDGTSSILIDNSGENDGTAAGGFGPGRWKFYSNAFRGENTAGTWRVQLTDADSTTASPIIIDDIDITFKGQSESIHDTFVFTEEYSDYAGRFGHSRAINGGNGYDTINAAAVNSSTTIDLTKGTGSIDGVNVTVSSIENVFTGDGHDRLFGNGSNNRLVGMRGNDTLYGDAGNDTLYGGDGNDYLSGGDGNDYLDAGLGNNNMIGGSGDDTYIYRGTGYVTENNNQGYDTVYSYKTFNINNASIERLYLSGSNAIDASGSVNNDLIYGNSANNVIRGQSGKDTLYGREGNDTLNGGNNDDMLYGDEGNDLLIGGYGVDTFYGGNGNDTVSFNYNVNAKVSANLSSGEVKFSGSSNVEHLYDIENLIGGRYDDTLTGNNAANKLEGLAGDDIIYGAAGDDYLEGNEGNDFLSGNSGTDTLVGGNGNDYLIGSSTNARNTKEYDSLYGGSGYDTFALGSADSDQLYSGTGYAIIKDWSSFYDTIQLKGNSSQYTLRYGNWVGSSSQDAAIVSSSNTDDFYGVIQDSTNISFTSDLRFV